MEEKGETVDRLSYLLGELIECLNELTVGLGGVETPPWHPQFQLWHGPEERVDAVYDALGLLVAVR